MSRRILLLALLMLGMIVSPAHALPRGALGGAGCDPSAPGHGLSIKNFDGQRAPRSGASSGNPNGTRETQLSPRSPASTAPR